MKYSKDFILSIKSIWSNKYDIIKKEKKERIIKSFFLFPKDANKRGEYIKNN